MKNLLIFFAVIIGAFAWGVFCLLIWKSLQKQEEKPIGWLAYASLKEQMKDGQVYWNDTGICIVRNNGYFSEFEFSGKTRHFGNFNSVSPNYMDRASTNSVPFDPSVIPEKDMFWKTGKFTMKIK